MEMFGSRSRLIKISYNDIESAKIKEYIFSVSFPNILDILNGIYEISPKIILDDFLKSALATTTERKELKKIIDE